MKSASATLSLFLAALCWVAARGAGSLRYAEVLPGYRMGRSTRECHVHRCEPTAEAVALEHARKCDRRRGHMEPIGSQQADMSEVSLVTLMDSLDFYTLYVASATPVVLAGAAHAATHAADWDDGFLLRACRTDHGVAWRSIIEENKIIITNTRYPLLSNSPDWDFCQYVLNYSKPEFSDSMYLVSPLTDSGVQLGRHVELPSVLRCSEVHESVHDTRLWMSSGSTSSSLHFDTHENLMLQAREPHGTAADSNKRRGGMA
jgi:hypothetical protein